MSKSDEKPLVVYKLGGSLLGLANLPDVVRQALAQRRSHGALIVVGGGPTADLVREWDRVHHLGDEAAHWLAIEAMRLNESLLSRLLPEVREVRSPKQVAAAIADGQVGLLCADCFARWGEANGHPPLPRTWDVTSDSIAAWCAALLAAEELVLVKSAPLAAEMTFEQAAREGLVDPQFPAFARALLRVSWLDARALAPEIRRWSGPAP